MNCFDPLFAKKEISIRFVSVTICLLFLLVGSTAVAQTYTESTIAILPPVTTSSLAFADLDGDLDHDLVIAGIDTTLNPITKLFLNNGNGAFTEASAFFNSVDEAEVAFADLDNDNDQDLIITGETAGTLITTIFLNDGLGNFQEKFNPSLVGTDAGGIAIADIDGDGDLDLYIAGFSGFNVKSGNLYTNDGTGTFTEVTGTGIDVLGSAAAFADIDGDNDQDLLITGTTGTTLNNVSTKLYRNDGQGSFTSDTNSNLIGSSSGAIAFMDMDGDADLDLFIVGYASGAIPTSTLYTNDGTGLFTQVAGTPFTGVAIGDIAIDDADDDGDIDILITGNAFPTAVTELYLNDGNGGFSLLSGTPFSGAVVSSVALRDVDGDFDKDVIVSGLLPGAGPGGFLTKVYLKDGVGSNVNVKETLEKEAGHLSIFPNPSNRGRITIGWSGSEEKVNGFTIFDVSGRTLIASQTPRILQGNRITVDTASLKQGTYLVEVYHDGTVSYGRFVVANSN